MIFNYDGVNAGSTYIINERVSDIAVVETDEANEKSAFTNVSPGRIIIIGLCCALCIAAATMVLIIAARNKEAREQRQRRLERRRKRLQELNVSEEEFMDMVKEEQNHSPRRPKRRGR